jgi:hypothetical protein
MRLARNPCMSHLSAPIGRGAAPALTSCTETRSRHPCASHQFDVARKLTVVTGPLSPTYFAAPAPKAQVRAATRWGNP